MSYAYFHEGSWVEITGEFSIGDEPQSGSWLNNETPESLAEEGIYFIGEEDNPKPGIRGARHIEERDGKPVWVYKILPVFNDVERAARKAEINGHIATAFFRGFVPDHPAFIGERLQVRDNDDKTNWMEALRRCSKKVEAGDGEPVEAKFRTESNKTIYVSYNDAVVILEALSDWAFLITERGWALKDAEAEGEEYDVTTGWPLETVTTSSDPE